MTTQCAGLRYQDAHAAMDWLCKAFGFEVFLSVPGNNDTITHARLTLGNNIIMLATLGREGEFDKNFVSPADCKGVTQCTMLYIENPDVVYQSARKANAKIIDELKDFNFGGATFTCKDPEGHLWVISSHDPWKKTW